MPTIAFNLIQIRAHFGTATPCTGASFLRSNVPARVCRGIRNEIAGLNRFEDAKI